MWLGKQMVSGWNDSDCVTQVPCNWAILRWACSIYIYTTTTAVRERESVCVCVCVCERERRRRGERENKRDWGRNKELLASKTAFSFGLTEWKAHQHHCNQHNPPNQQHYNCIMLHYALQVQQVEPGGGMSGRAGRTAGLGSLQPVRWGDDVSTAADAAKRWHHRKHCRLAFLLLFFNSVYLYTRVDGASICCSKAGGTVDGASIY